jgi:hypothetical protein
MHTGQADSYFTYDLAEYNVHVLCIGACIIECDVYHPKHRDSKTDIPSAHILHVI